MTWKLNSFSMNSGNVVVVVEPGSMGSRKPRRKQETALLHGAVRRHNLGEDQERFRLRFWFIGPHTERYARMKWARQQMESPDFFTLQAPDAPNEVRVAGDNKAATFDLDDLGVIHEAGVGRVGLDVEATLKFEGTLDPSLDEGGYGGPAFGESAFGT